jgi:hypothetical protein
VLELELVLDESSGTLVISQIHRGMIDTVDGVDAKPGLDGSQCRRTITIHVLLRRRYRPASSLKSPSPFTPMSTPTPMSDDSSQAAGVGVDVILDLDSIVEIDGSEAVRRRLTPSSTSTTSPH